MLNLGLFSEILGNQEKLNLPESALSLKADEKGLKVFDRYRKKYVRLSPEEWVRQQLLNYLSEGLGYPGSLINVEGTVPYNGIDKRADAVIYKGTRPVMIVECKAASVDLSQETFDQIARYNFTLKVDYLLVSNGLRHFCCKMDYPGNTYHYLNQIPAYAEL